MNYDDFEEIEQRADKTCSNGRLDADKAFKFFYYDVPALINEVRRLHELLDRILDDHDCALSTRELIEEESE
jgi:hypothetical protein